MFAAGGLERQLAFWDTATGRKLPLIIKHDQAIIAVAFMPDDKSVLSVSFDGKIQLWDAASGARREQASAARNTDVAALAQAAAGWRLAVSKSGFSSGTRPR